MVSVRDLSKLHAVVQYLLQQEWFPEALARLKAALGRSPEPFVWSTIDLDSIPGDLPAVIQSCWIFVLKKDVPSGCHYHPNSVQHMIVISGRGVANIGGSRRRMVAPESSTQPLLDQWYVIDQNVPHEFFPESEDMTVISFHTCRASELQEIACDTGRAHLYRPPAVSS